MSYPRTAPTAQLPADIAQLASARGLGPWLRTHPAAKLGAPRLILLVLFEGALLFCAAALAVNQVWPGAVICALLAVPGVWMAVKSPTFNPGAAARSVYLFEQGMIEAGKGGAVDYRWDQIDWVTQAVTHVYRYGIKVRSIYIFTVRRMDGHTTKITHFYAGIADLGNAIAHRVTEVQLPRAIAALRAGQTVNFGDLAVNMSGVASAGKGAVPWTEIQKVSVNNGVVSLARQGKWLSWSSKQAKDIPNLFVFLELANRLAAAGR
jgi:hypothetical protein